MTKTTCIHKDAPSIEQIYQRYQRPILTHLVRLVGQRETAEDLCQETFLKAWRSWQRRDPGASVGAWLYRIATNTAYDHLRRRRRISFTPLYDADCMLVCISSMEAQLAEGEPIQAALAQIPPHYRRLLVLQVCEGRSIHEIACVLGCTDDAVKTRLYRARLRFREVYERQSCPPMREM